MNFPDHNHLIQLRKELWQRPRSRAAVMVGAGFSLNARPSPGIDTPFLTWRQLTRAMFDEIYPPTDRTIIDREEKFNRCNPLRLASEYEAAFERQKLEYFIRTHVPDSGHQPGPIHDLLLQLPWRDVFTTNYDTLLERTEVTERAYQPVTTVEALTAALPPRIVKLHGTLPSQTPFIMTEEDYRTYPKRFAPFVNTVRQSLIENSFVLIGFSGDDPNFLEWVGWIRDELEDHHAPIYLTGVLSLDHVERSLLAKRGVTPIDLAPVFPNQSESPAPAIKWFLKNLKVGRPPSVHKWPKGNTVTQETRDYQPALLIDGLSEPEDVSLLRTGQQLDEKTAWKVLDRWTFERGCYPGWMVAPNRVRSSVWKKTGRWIHPLIEFSKGRSPTDRILIFYELNWRIEVSMMPLFEDTKEPFEAAVEDLFLSLSHGSAVDPPSKDLGSLLPMVCIEEAWLELAFALLREAREIYDRQRWNQFKERIDRIVTRTPKFSDRCHYEQALWMMWNIRRPEAKETLDEWSPSPDAVLATMRKAGLLAELDALNEAQELLRETLHHIRRSVHTNVGPNLYLISLEGWCIYLMYDVEMRIDLDNMAHGRGKRDYGLYDRYSDRWQELKAFECSPWPMLEHFESALTEEPPGPSQTEIVVADFDPGVRVVERHIRGTGMDLWLPAFACIRLYEQVGIPLRFSGSALSNACRWVMQFNSFWSPALLILAGKIDRLKEQHLLDRTRIANMKGNLAINIHQWALDALKREQSVLTREIPLGSHLGKLLEALIEVLFRLTIKIGSVELQDAMSVALRLHSEPGIYAHTTLHKKCRSWTERLLEAADDEQIIDWLPDMIRSVIPEEDIESKRPLQWKDPIRDVPVRLRKNEDSRVREAISWLLDRARSASGPVWRRTVMRLILIRQSEMMTSDQEAEIGSILWKHTARDGFPDLPGVDRVMFLYCPTPKEVDIVDKLRTHLLGGTPQESVTDIPGGRISVRDSPDPLILAMARASRPIIHVPYEWKGLIDWSRKDAKILWLKVVEWWHNDKRALHLGSFFRADGVIATARNAAMFLWRAVLPTMDAASEEDWKDILAFLQDTQQHGVYLTTAWSYVLIHRSSEVHRVGRMIINDLSSEVEEAVAAGAEALRHWIHLADAGLSEGPPAQAVYALLHRVVFRRRIGAASCLRQLTLLLDEQPKFFGSCHVDLMISSLIPWSESTRLPVLDGQDGDFRENERPELRVHLGGFAAALSKWLSTKYPGRSEPQAITDLRDQYASDPLPEVRRSFDGRS